MSEIWLRQNVRVTAFVAGTFLLIAAGLASLAYWGFDPQQQGWRVVAWVGVAALLIAAAAVCCVGLRPRLAYSQGHLCVFLRLGAPYRVPIEYVEAFLLGQSPAMPGNHNERTETKSLSIKLADRAEDWQHQETLPAWGKWCGGYITILGTWSEPLSLDVVNRLNHRLSEVQSESSPVKQSSSSFVGHK